MSNKHKHKHKPIELSLPTINAIDECYTRPKTPYNPKDYEEVTFLVKSLKWLSELKQTLVNGYSLFTSYFKTR